MKIQCYLIIFFLLIVLSCNKESIKRISLTVSLVNYPENKHLILYHLNNGVIPFDTATITTQGDYFFSRPIKQPDFYQIKFNNNQTLSLILHPKEETIIKADADNVISSAVIHNNPESNKILKAERISRGLKSEINGLTAQLTDKSLKKSLRDSILLTIDTLKIIRKQIINKLIDTSEYNLSILPIILQKSGNHSFFNIKTDSALFVKTDTFLIKNYWYSDLVKTFHYQLDSAFAFANNNTNIKLGEKLAEPNIPTYWNETLTLSKFSGKPILIFFWKSDMPENKWMIPEVEKYIRKAKEHDLEIWMISLDVNKKNWENSIDYYKLACWHFSDLLGFNSNSIKKLGIRNIPANILIDKKGIIISKNTWGNLLNESVNSIISH
ncbi:MAG: TlpA family protein disulfide reductase [Marinilabiliaceae bacterium]|nr:TlpA family protein disulfide reductase [Marinilabiliaceae bacterium]